MVRAEDATPRTWAAVPAGTVCVGTWGTGSAFLDPTDGLIAHVAGWNRLLAPVHMQDLVRTQSVAWAVDINAGVVQADQSKVVSVRQGGWHGKTPLTVTAGDGSLVTTTKGSDEITILAGGSTGSNDAFTFSFTDANGKTSPTRTVTIGVVEASAALTRPSLASATGQDPNPSGSVWWNPTSGNNSDNGTTKALAKLTLSAAEGALGAERTECPSFVARFAAAHSVSS